MKDIKQYIDWDVIQEQVLTIACQINDDDWKPRKICGVNRGGLIPGVILSHALNIPFEPIEPLTILMDSKNVLIVDDIYDTGKTVQQLKTLNRNARFATIFLNDDFNEDAVDYFGNFYSGEEWIVFPWETDD